MKYARLIAIALFAMAMNGHAIARTITFPGTKLSVDVSSDLSLAGAGSALIDEQGETIILFSGGKSKANLETDPTWRALYRREPEKITTKSIQGNLYKRTRKDDGGKWDGWFLAVPRGERSLIVMASYTGPSQAKFERIRDQLLTIQWDDTYIDSEEAMGVRLKPEGLRMVPDMFGALSYNAEGRMGGPGPDIMVQLIPVPSSQARVVVSSGCSVALGNAFSGAAYEGPAFYKQDGLELCEAWSSQTSKEVRYASFVRTRNDVLLMIAGTSTAAQFKEFLPKVRRAVHQIVALQRK